VLATLSASREGAPFAELNTTLWKGRETRLELLGPAPAEGETGAGLELFLTGDFNRAGEFWGKMSVVEFDRTRTGDRVEYLGIPHEERFGPSPGRSWTIEVPGKDGMYLVHLEMEYDFWTASQLARPRFLHRPKFLK
jgi:hypothetical protein